MHNFSLLQLNLCELLASSTLEFTLPGSDAAGTRKRTYFITSCNRGGSSECYSIFLPMVQQSEDACDLSGI